MKCYPPPVGDCIRPKILVSPNYLFSALIAEENTFGIFAVSNSIAIIGLNCCTDCSKRRIISCLRYNIEFILIISDIVGMIILSGLICKFTPN